MRVSSHPDERSYCLDSSVVGLDNSARVMGMITAKGNLIYDSGSNNPRACIYVKSAITEVHLQVGDGNIIILFALVSLTYDSLKPPITSEMRWIVEHGTLTKRHLIVGRYTNAHHTAWGTSKIIKKDEASKSKGNRLGSFKCGAKKQPRNKKFVSTQGVYDMANSLQNAIK
ncbi:hypothetical protein J6590_071256 [Homalodisca vitripennis]|nr:hypothetical protein J6590_071256 [Homalodisca vitripennis]